MAAHKSPAFQFYPDDFLGSGKVGTMTTDEVGAYTLLLCLEWNETGFVFDEEELARWCRMSRAKFRKAWSRVSRCFEERDGRMYNPRLQKEREKQAEWREKSAKGGRASAQAKAKGGARVVQPPLVPNGNTPVSSLQSPSPVTTQQQLPATAGTAKPSTIRVRKPRPAAPWMGLVRPAWTLGTLPPGAATQLEPVVAAIGAEETAARIRRYCEETDPQYASLRSFVTKHAAYADVSAVDPATGLPNAAGMRALGGGRR